MMDEEKRLLIFLKRLSTLMAKFKFSAPLIHKKFQIFASKMEKFKKLYKKSLDIS